jgi:lipopolysaccharide/colanic/teichoic acid biosynthesis glycosyltransferase
MKGEGRSLAYCRGPLKRSVDVVCSVATLLVAAPLLCVIATLVAASMGHPIFFLQERVGLDGRRFRMLKFRTMRRGAAGLPITGRGDPRITRLGRILRASKLDELPQLLNIIRGDMSVVGPRPEVPRYVASDSRAQQRILMVRPGLTDPATVRFTDEEGLLGAVPEGERERHYRAEILPKKIALNLEYLERAGFWYDLRLVIATLWTLVRRGT